MSRRLHVLIDEDRYQRPAATARRRGISVATVVREAIDRSLEPPIVGRAAAARSFLAAPPMEADTVEDLLEELNELRSRRA